MFDVSMSGTRANVKRSLTLPQKGPLSQLELNDTYTVQLDLGGLDPKSPTAREILKTFPKVYAYELNSVRKKYDDPCIKIWTDAGKMAADSKADRAKVEKAGAKAQSEIVRIWNEFNTKRAKPLAASTLDSVAKGVAKKARENVNAKVAFSSDDLKENRVGILGSILKALALGAVSGGLGWIVAALGGVSALSTGYRNAWEIGQKRSADAQVNLNRIDDGLDAALSILQKLEPSLARLESSQKEATASIVSAKAELNKMTKRLDELEKRAKKEKAIAEAKHLGTLRAETAKQEAKVQSLGADARKMGDLGKAVREATKSVESAGKLVKAERGKWDRLMAGYQKVSKDGDTMLSTLATVLKKLS